MAQKNHQQNSVKRYLLKQLSAAEQQEVELRLLSDDSFAAELDTAEEELIDEYLTQELSEDERVKFEQDFLTTPERHSKLRSAQAFKRYLDRIPVDPVPKKRSISELLRNWFGPPSGASLGVLSSQGSVGILSSRAAMAFTLLVVAVTGLIIWRVVFYQSDLKKGLLALNEAYRQERPIEARVSTLDYAPFLTKRSGESQQVNTFELDRAQRFLSDAEKDQANSDSAHALGKLYLLQKEYDKAIEYLEKAAKADTKNAQIYADLGAAYLEKGKLESDAGKSNPPGAETGNGLKDLGRSVEYSKQALEINPNLLEALFNLALAHQHQALYTEAEADWRSYLEKDPSSQWAVDARQNLKLLEGQKNRKSQNSDDKFKPFMVAYRARDDTAAWEIYRRSHAPTGNAITKVLVDQLLANDSGNKSTENLQALIYLGQLETRNAQDAYTSDLAQVYASATPQTKELLLQARQQVVKAHKLVSQNIFGEATDLFANARETFDRVGDRPESLAASASMARVAALEPDLAKGQEIVASLVPACELNRYKWLLGYVLIRRAHIESNLNDFSEAISDGNRALQIFLELKDLSGTLESLTQLATLHYFLNDKETSLSFLKREMVIAQEEGASPTQLWPIYINLSLNFSALQLYRAALDYQNEALQLALCSGNPLLLSRSFQFIGLSFGALRHFDPAFENIRLAYEQGKNLSAERIGQSMMASASLRLGDLYRAYGDQASALAAYEDSSRLYEALEFHHYSYAAHKGKFLSYLAQNNDALAAQELRTVLNLFDKYREKILGERQTTFFFDREQDTYDLAIDFTYFRLGDQQRAFDYSENSRARNLSDLMQHGAKVTPGASGLDLQPLRPDGSKSALPLTVAEIQQQLPEQVQIVQYAVLEKKLLVWCITRSGIFTRFVDVESSKLEETVTTALTQIKQQDQGAADSLKRLHDLLIEPIRSQLDPNKVICFIPDKTLHFLPFGALISRSSGRYLVQDYRVMTSPSATILIDSTNKARERSAVTEEHLLAVGNPTFDRAANPNLPNLASAEWEVKEIAANYPSKRLLIGAQATQKSVKDGLAQAEVAHVAAHYQIDPISQLSSKVVLSPEPGDWAHAQLSGLSSGDIYQMNLARTKLVVLSACQTGIEQQLRGEGPIGFARSFLVAGVPVVVASLWPVDSEATSELMILFHRFRRVDHLSTTEALTRAQQEIMTSEKYHHPYYWAGFTAIGGYSEF
jgi:CHAT domain-containing protein/tetratricopeptide (TPR) repeat protein